MNPADQKKISRQQLRLQRSQLSFDFCELASQQIAQRLASLDFIQQARHLAFYWPAQQECDPLPLIKQLTSTLCYLPAINKQTKLLEFYLYRPEQNLTPNQFNILEPETHPKNRIKTEDLDVVLMPLLGFDEKGDRLGMGGGYYDRSFAFIKTAPHPRPLLIGLAYQLQKLEYISREPWDVALDYVVTESQLYFQ